MTSHISTYSILLATAHIYLAEEVLNDSQGEFVDFGVLMLLQCLNLVQTFTLLNDHTHLFSMAQLLGSL